MSISDVYSKPLLSCPCTYQLPLVLSHDLQYTQTIAEYDCNHLENVLNFKSLCLELLYCKENEK